MKSGEILSYERQVEYVLQDKFKYKGKTILPINIEVILMLSGLMELCRFLT